ERPSLSLELVDRLAGDRHVHAGGRRARVVDGAPQRKPVRREQFDGAVVRAEHSDLVLDQLRPVLADEAADEYGVGSGRLDAVVQGLIGRCLWIERGETGDLDAE